MNLHNAPIKVIEKFNEKKTILYFEEEKFNSLYLNIYTCEGSCAIIFLFP